MRASHSRHLVSRIASCLVATLVAVAALPLGPAAAAGAVVWVGPGGSDMTGAGTRANPYRSLREGLLHVGSGDTLNVLPGTYSATFGEAFPLVPANGVWIRGIGPGKPKIQGNGVDTIFQYFSRSGTITGLELTGAGSGGPSQDGAAVIVVWNDSYYTMTIEDCWIHDNSRLAGGGGGGISANASGNGAIAIRGCRVEDNHAYGSGGGIYVQNIPDVTIEDCVVSGNRAESDTGNGGGIDIGRASLLTLRDCEITKNRAGTAVGGAGGGLHLFMATGVVLNTLVALNGAPANGTAAWCDASNLHMHNCTISDNYLTFANPGATQAVLVSGASTVTLHSCVVWSNIPTDITSVGLTFDWICTDDNHYSGTGYVKTDPQFIRPTDEGPNYRIARTSPCIDSGSLSPYATPFDLDGRARVIDGNVPADIRVDIGAYEVANGATRRLSGTSRYKTAVAAWEATMDHANSAVLAVGSNFPDALSASALAGAVEGPLLLVQQGTVPAEVLDELESLGVTGVYLVGGTSVISDAVKTSLETLGYNVVRVAGGNRYATAAAVAAEVKSVMGSRYASQVVVARGDDFPDALAASPWAYAQGMPVLLTETDALPAATGTAIVAGGANGVFIVGGTGVVSADVASAIDALPGIGTPRRIAGGNRYATAVEVAKAATGVGANGVDVPFLGWHEVGLATGLDFPDALAGGAACGYQRGVMLLTAPTSLAPAAATELAAQKARVYRVTALGGTSVVSDAVKNAAGAAVQYW